MMGFPLKFEGFRNWRFARFFIAVPPAVSFTVLVLLYIANFISNTLWGSNINYRLTLDYMFRLAGIVKELPIRASWIYVPVVALVVLILSVYLCLSGPI